MQTCKTRQIVATALAAGLIAVSSVSHAQQYSQGAPYGAYGYYAQPYPQQPQQEPGGLRGLLPAGRGYDVQQGQQAASWYYEQPQAPRSRKTVTPAATPKAAAPASGEARKPAVPAAPTPKPARPARKKEQAASTDTWYTSFDSAWKKACDQGRPLVVLFVHHGCPECDKMDYYLAQPGSAASLACAVKVRIEFTQNPEVVNRFGVKLTPTFLVLSPSGGEAYREVGALTPERLKQIQPALESLVTGPPEKETSLKTKEKSVSPQDHNTSQTVAAL